MGKKKSFNKENEAQDRSKKGTPNDRSPIFFPYYLLIVFVGIMLIFTHLSNRYLWSDEAETALLARNIITFGVPKAFDGKTLISQEAGREYDADYIWRWTPWLDKYIAAASFKALGEGTLSARLPFALIGILSIFSLYFLAEILFKDRWLSLLAMCFLVFSVPFLLYVRQCRYYSIAIFAAIWAVYFFFSLLNGKRRSALGFVIAMTMLFHSNYLLFLGSAFSLFVCFLALYFEKKVLRRVLVSYSLLFLINLPWFIFFHLLGKTKETGKLLSFSENVSRYFSQINEFSFPLAALLLFSGFALMARKRKSLMNTGAARPFLFLLIFSVVYVLFISLAPWSFFRYIIILLPLFAILHAFMARHLWRWNRGFALIFTILLLFSGVFNRASVYPFLDSGYFKSREQRADKRFDLFFPLGNYLYEITHDLDGPIETMVTFLEENAETADRVFISYGDLPLKFYLDLEVKGGQTGEDLTDWPPPDWVIVRSFFRFGDRDHLKQDAYKMGHYLDHLFAVESYLTMEIPVVDSWWENIPEPQFHRFRDLKQGPSFEIYRHIGGPREVR